LFFSLFNAFDNMWDLNYAQNTTNGRNILLADDITINNSTVLQLRYSFTRHHEDQGGDPRQNGFDITTLGFPSSLAAEQVYKTLPFVLFNDVGGGVGVRGVCVRQVRNRSDGELGRRRQRLRFPSGGPGDAARN
jgi:hypothetical protein